MVTVPPASMRLSETQFWERFGFDESSTLEFKERLTKAGKTQDTVVAFANTRGGNILVGVSEARPRTIVGVRWDQELQERVQEMARMTHPPHAMTPVRLAVGRLTLALIQVPAVDRGWVQTSDGRLIVRAGPTNRVLVGHELQRFIQERGSDPIEDQPLRDVGWDDLDSEAVRRFAERRLVVQREDLRTTLQNLGFLDPRGRVRLAALLLFGTTPQRGNRRLGIAILRFEGSIEGKVILRDRRQLDGTLPELVIKADRAIYEEMRREAVVRGLVREEVPEYPSLALREALVNAVGHRDYSLRGSAIEVRLFDDAIEIESPGGLAGWVTLENLRTAQYSRNERIMEGLQVLGFVEEAGTGIDRMYAEMEEALLNPPQFEERHSSFLVRFQGRSVFAAEDRLWVARFTPLGLVPHAKVALVYARRNGAVTNEALQALRGLPSREARSVLQDLVARDLLEAVGRGRGTRYVLGNSALRAPRRAGANEQVKAIVAHARRAGSLTNRDVRGLLGLDSIQARELLEAAVAQGQLQPVGERRGRRYLPTRMR